MFPSGCPSPDGRGPIGPEALQRTARFVYDILSQFEVPKYLGVVALLLMSCCSLCVLFFEQKVLLGCFYMCALCAFFEQKILKVAFICVMLLFSFIFRCFVVALILRYPLSAERGFSGTAFLV